MADEYDLVPVGHDPFAARFDAAKDVPSTVGVSSADQFAAARERLKLTPQEDAWLHHDTQPIPPASETANGGADYSWMPFQHAHIPTERMRLSDNVEDMREHPSSALDWYLSEAQQIWPMLSGQGPWSNTIDAPETQMGIDAGLHDIGRRPATVSADALADLLSETARVDALSRAR